jgi:hypothetical protein
MRNQNHHLIMGKLGLGMSEWPVSCKFDHLWFFGDLNYRLDLSEETVLNSLRSNQIAELFEADQLTHARKMEAAFAGFDEDPPQFFPTFKLVKSNAAESEDAKSEEFAVATIQRSDGHALNYFLQRIPAFCDRILVKSAKVRLEFCSLDSDVEKKHAKHRVKRIDYEAVFALSSSDHAPGIFLVVVVPLFSKCLSVFSSFTCGVDWKQKSLFDGTNMMEKVRKGQKEQKLCFSGFRAANSTHVHSFFQLEFVAKRRKCWI